MRVLLAEDDRRLGKLVQYMLEQNKIKADKDGKGKRHKINSKQ